MTPPIYPPPVLASKKKHRAVLGGRSRAGRTHAQARAEPLLRWLQETHVAPLVPRLPRRGVVGSAGQLGHPGECVRRRSPGAQFRLLPAPMDLVPAARSRRHGLPWRRSQAPLSRALARGRADQTAPRQETRSALRGVESSRLPAGHRPWVRVREASKPGRGDPFPRAASPMERPVGAQQIPAPARSGGVPPPDPIPSTSGFNRNFAVIATAPDPRTDCHH